MGGAGSGTKGAGTRPWHSAFMQGKRLALKHGHTRQGSKISPTYATWRSMLARCYNASNPSYPYYGAVGKTVCERWRLSFENFLTDMGERPAGTTLDRFPDRAGIYEPGNCRWATNREQSRNRDSVLTFDLANEIMGRLEYGEKEDSVARRLGKTRATINAIRRGKIWKDLTPFQEPLLPKRPLYAIADLVAGTKCGTPIGKPCNYNGNHKVRLKEAARISVSNDASTAQNNAP